MGREERASFSVSQVIVSKLQLFRRTRKFPLSIESIGFVYEQNWSLSSRDREVPPKAPYLYVYNVARDGIYATLSVGKRMKLHSQWLNSCNWIQRLVVFYWASHITAFLTWIVAIAADDVKSLELHAEVQLNRLYYFLRIAFLNMKEGRHWSRVWADWNKFLVKQGLGVIATHIIKLMTNFLQSVF